MAVIKADVTPTHEGPDDVPVVQPSRMAVALVAIAAVLVAVAAGTGLFWGGGTAPAAMTLSRGDAVALYGVGLYRFESVIVGPVHRGTDVVALVLWLPLLIVGATHYRRASIRGTFVLLAALAWYAYLYLSLAVGAAYNELFLVYVALVALCVSALVLVSRSITVEQLAQRVSSEFPRRATAHLFAFTAAGTALAWGSIAVQALLSRQAPAHMHATTTVEEALSLGLLVPAFVFAAVVLYRGDRGLGVLLAVPLLGLVASLAPVVLAQTVSQSFAGVVISFEETARLVAVWLVFGGLAIWLLARVWRTVDAT